ncbi:MAG: exonuclease domain-containing protein [Clostridiales bacterium]|jgi:inhibitor of KinA sporulation pathway (predicted exonuclease)|nr:exonuclease domain-containing protein [Clostridiales bacterium]
MYYIVFDLEFNQDPDSLVDSSLKPEFPEKKGKYPFEIIQLGAVKLDVDFNRVGTFSRLVKPSIYSRISEFVTELTGITNDSLDSEQTFSQVYKEFLEFVNEPEIVLCVWGMTDMKELIRNAVYHKLDEKLLPNRYINIQPQASVHLGMPKKKPLGLKYCVEALEIEVSYLFHDALNDALYTAEVFKKVYTAEVKPRRYDQAVALKSIRPAKMTLDFPMLISQLEKMFSKEMSTEEKEIIRLAYHMGKTGQFLKADETT